MSIHLPAAPDTQQASAGEAREEQDLKRARRAARPAARIGAALLENGPLAEQKGSPRFAKHGPIVELAYGARDQATVHMS